MSTTLSTRDIQKRYGAVTALASASMEIRGGEVVALLGSNGSGKSTLGKIITGITRPDRGTLLLDGEQVAFLSPIQARRAGITAVYQELSLVPNMSVAENIWLGHEPMRLGGVDKAAMKRHGAELLELFAGCLGPTVSSDSLISELSPGERQVVEVLKALSRQPRVLILDEATASLDARQVERLFELIVQWRRQGMAVAFISHRMDEIFRIADRAVVLRNGSSVGERTLDDTDADELVSLMTGGAEMAASEERQGVAVEEVVLAVRGLSAKRLAAFDIDLHRGELLGLGGLQGQGQEEILLALFGALAHRGEVALAGRELRLASPREAMHHGFAYVPGDRGSEGLLPIRPIIENLHLAGWRRYGTPIDIVQARRDALAVAAELNIKFADLEQPVTSLSGGNAQKVVIGKWLLREPAVLLLNDPTKGIDVGAKSEFYVLLQRLRNSGVAILFHSSDDEELLTLCDRIAVMHDGRLSALLEGPSLVRERLVAASVGTGTGGAGNGGTDRMATDRMATGSASPGNMGSESTEQEPAGMEDDDRH